MTRTASGQIAQIGRAAATSTEIRTDGLDFNFAYRARTPMSWGTFGFTWNNTFLLNYDVIVPSAPAGR